MPIPEAARRSSRGGKVGRLTSGGYSVTRGKFIAMGYVPPELVAAGTVCRSGCSAEFWEAEVVGDSPHDPENARIREDG